MDTLNEISDIYERLNNDRGNGNYHKYSGRLSELVRKCGNNHDKEKIVNLLLELSSKSGNQKIQNIFLNEAEILQQKVVLKSKPRNMQVLLTSLCNLRCSICDVHLKEYSLSDEGIEFIKNGIQYLDKIIWQGGEVFLHKDFDCLVELAGSNGVRQDVITNGLLLTDGRLKKFIKYGVNLKISIDAVDKNTYEKIRIGGDFDHLIGVLSSLKKYKLQYPHYDYSMAVVITSLNCGQINDIVDFALKYGFSRIIFQQYTPYSNKDLILDPNQCDNVIRQIISVKQKADAKQIPIEVYTDMRLENKEPLPNKEEIKREKYEDDKKNDAEPVKEELNNNAVEMQANNDSYNLFCYAPWTTIFLDLDDKLRFSCRCARMDIKTYNEMWNNKDIVAYRQMLVDSKNLYECCKICENASDSGKFSRWGIL